MSNQLTFGDFAPRERTLRDAQQEVLANRDDGIECPCCHQFAKTYKRTVTSTMARWLIELVRRFDGDWVSVSEPWSLKINKGTGDVGKLVYWDLVERAPKDADDTARRTSGLWRPRPRGVQFVHQDLTVERYAHVYDGAVIGYSGGPWSIAKALGRHWDYHRLMRGEL